MDCTMTWRIACTVILSGQSPFLTTVSLLKEACAINDAQRGSLEGRLAERGHPYSEWVIPTLECGGRPGRDMPTAPCKG